MTLFNTSKVLLGISAAALLSIAGLVNDASGTASAAGRPRAGRTVHNTVTRTGPEGRTARRDTTRTATEHGFESSTSVTGPGGKTATREQTGNYDPATKTWTRDANSVGPNGKTASTEAVVQKTDSGYTRDVTHTGPNGKSVTTQGSGSYDASTGTLTQERTKTGPNGKSSTVSREVTVTPPAK
jgi:hypothetical protein